MTVAFYVSFMNVFNRLVESWARVLKEHGHEVDVIWVPESCDKPIAECADADVHVIVAGVHILLTLARFGGLKKGRKVLWMFDPLPERTETSANVHGCKIDMLLAAAGETRFDAAIGMNAGISGRLHELLPGIPICTVPYTFDETFIRKPIPDNERETEVLQLGWGTVRRKLAEIGMQRAGVPARFVYSGMWGAARYDLIANAKVSLNIHADGHTYFTQHRIFDAWAQGSAVVSEPMGDLNEYGVEPGVHLEIAEFGDMPGVCEQLLEDEGKRAGMVAAGQDLLRACYTTDGWTDILLGALGDGN